VADCYDQDTRRRVMSRIRSSGTAPEEALARLLERWLDPGDWVRHPEGMVGKPDFLLPGPGVAIFVDGCFFHGCPLHHRAPATNAEYWEAKVARNIRRDRAVSQELRRQGLKVMRIWEHELRGAKPPGRERIRRRIRRAMAQSGD
jgi:DNA mismatch endonuclease (patch repair protein)